MSRDSPFFLPQDCTFQAIVTPASHSTILLNHIPSKSSIQTNEYHFYLGDVEGINKNVQISVSPDCWRIKVTLIFFTSVLRQENQRSSTRSAK
jgi:hypothetical protein